MTAHHLNAVLAWLLSQLVSWPSEVDFVVAELGWEQVQLEGQEEREQEG